ncbi:MAG: DUF4097 family beta strand repeat-containing protein [Bacteroidota bacterium]
MAVPTQADDAGDIQDSIKESFEVEPGGTLYIDADQGSIEIEAVREQSVQIEVIRIVDGRRADADRLFETHTVEMSERDGDVTIRSEIDNEDSIWNAWRGKVQLKVRIRVRIPEDYDVDFETGAGNVWVADAIGDIEGRTGAGNVDLEAISGDVDIRSGAGNITLEDIFGDIDLRSGAGNVSVRGARGYVDAATGAGNLTAELTEQPNEDCSFETGAGNVTVYINDDLQVDVDAVAAMGSASTDFPIEVQGKWMKKSFEGSLNGGGPEIRLRAGVGNVTLRRL